MSRSALQSAITTAVFFGLTQCANDDGARGEDHSQLDASAEDAANGDGDAFFADGSGSDGDASPTCGHSTCTPDQFCDTVYDGCGTIVGDFCADPIFYCESRPTECPSTDRAACGCDGKVHRSACVIYKAGMDVSAHKCAPDAGPRNTFGCGPHYCTTDEFCKVGHGDTCDISFACLPLPASCAGKDDCNCLEPGQHQWCDTIKGNGVTGFELNETLL